MSEGSESTQSVAKAIFVLHENRKEKFEVDDLVSEDLKSFFGLSFLPQWFKHEKTQMNISIKKKEKFIDGIFL